MGRSIRKRILILALPLLGDPRVPQVLHLENGVRTDCEDTCFRTQSDRLCFKNITYSYHYHVPSHKAEDESYQGLEA